MLDTTMPTSSAPTEADAADDDALVRAAAAGDVTAYERIYRRHSPRVYAVLWRLCGGHAARAEDALQEAFLQAWRALPGFRFESSLGTWLHRLGVNAALMELRANATGDARDAGEEGWESLAMLPAQDRCAGTSMDLERALETLPPRARAVLVLHDIEGWKHQEIADQLQMAVGSSKAQLHRARGLLRARLGETA
ncbi:sigma-70 family RNA polymerase sigma factor [Stenotrophomonas sp. JAI102]|uniref:RNA polymerase sigma factor n=1 Tax=Stenotrophomonas sp. JAI102 TaxID=2723077 RepID=UPI0015CC1BF5|nr:sigma-70 family RNA polymerase sigma factor [Stenotrophomonas sp. JAI102]